MESRKLDPDSGVPFYRQISSILKDCINRGDFKIGDMLPSETELMEAFGISRITARLALKNLEDDGLLTRKRGKGTFFNPKVKINASNLLSFTQEIEKLGFQAGNVLLDVKIEKSKPRITDMFQFSSPQNILKVFRLRTANNQPVGICTSYLNLVEFPKLRFQDYNKLSLYAIIERDLNLLIVRAKQTIMADIVSKKESKLLKLQEGSPVMRVYRTTFVEGDIPIDIAEAVFNAKSYYYNSDLYREISIRGS